MTALRRLLLLTLVVSASGFASIDYPETLRSKHVDCLHGVDVADPYRWLENSESPNVQAWVEAQREVTERYFDKLDVRERLVERLNTLCRYTQKSVPYHKGQYFYWSVQEPGQNHPVHYRGKEAFGDGQLVIDPNTLSEDGTVALGGSSVSPDAKLLAYAISDGGSDWRIWHVRNIETQENLPDSVRWSKFSDCSWAPDGSGFYYSGYDAPTSNDLTDTNSYHKLFFHLLGAQQTEDELIFETPDHADWLFSAKVHDGRYLVIDVADGCRAENGIFYLDLKDEEAGVVRLLEDFDASYELCTAEEGRFYVLTTHEAPLGKFVAIDLDQPDSSKWTTIIPEVEGAKLETVKRISKKWWVAKYLKDVHSQIIVFHESGQALHSVDLPAIGSVGTLHSAADDGFFYGFSNMVTPPSVYAYEIKRGISQRLYEADVNFDSSDYVTRQVFYESKDGTKIPMFISHRKDVEYDGQQPTLLYGYGGFNISIAPSFSWGWLAWLERGGVACIANIRGGGEYGQVWHEAGMLHKKQNVFDDFIAAAEYLISSGISSADRIGILGGSNGGLLIGACMNQRPELFGAAIPCVGVLDMLRFHKFTIGKAWCTDYGSPEDPADFEVLRSYSPYHNLQPGTSYPATLVCTAERDDRVVPAHSFKYAAQLQHCQAGGAPTLIRIEGRAGHGAGKPISKRVELYADQWAFLIENLKADQMRADPQSRQDCSCCW